MKTYKIAIDGPAGVGKSSTAKAVAKKLGYIYVDTGAMYRSVGVYCINNNLQPEDVIPYLDDITIDIKYENDAQKVFLNGEDVTKKIRTPEGSIYASKVAVIKEVRDKLVSLQKAMGKVNNVVMDGRDIGTVVFPNAELKIYMTADPMVRAERRYKELTAKGDNVTLEEVYANVVSRDKADMSRAISPLRKADDAIVLDNSTMSVEEQMSWFDEQYRRVTAQ